MKLLCFHHHFFLANYFEIKKTHVLIQRKFYKLKIPENIKE